MGAEPPDSDSATAAAAAAGGHVAADDLPMIDLRVLSQSDLNTLAFLSTPQARAAFSASDLVVPKIDRSVFNESAGGRKQTYSRLRLDPPRPSGPSSPLARRRRLLPGPPSPPPNPSPDSDKAENKRIVDFLRDLFVRRNSGAASSPHHSPDVILEDRGGSTAVEEKGPAPAILEDRGGSTAVEEKWPVPAVLVDTGGSTAVEEKGPAPAVLEDTGGSTAVEVKGAVNVEEVEVLNKRGEMVDVAALENMKDLFGEELRRRTIGLQTEAELLEYLRGLNGTWGSRRKKRKIVDADEFGHDLPRGWKLILGIKRKEGSVWLYCRRFISPTGLQFASCKDISSYLRSYIGTQDGNSQNIESSETASQMVVSSTPPQPTGDDSAREVPICYAAVPISSIATNPGQQVVLFRVENPAKAQLRNLLECRKCNLTFDCKDKYVQHLSDVHQRNAKRTRLGKSVGDGVIMNGDKFECQFCHKIFDERRRYNGHVGIHVRNYGKSLEEIPDEIIVQTSIDPSFLTVIPPVVVPPIVPTVVSQPSGSNEKDVVCLAATSYVNQLNVVPPEANSNNIDQCTNFAPVPGNSVVNVLHKPNLNHETLVSAATDEERLETDECSAALNIVTAIKSINVDITLENNFRSSPVDMDMGTDMKHEILNVDATSTPTKTEMICGMIEDGFVAPFNPSATDLDSSQNRTGVSSVSFNKEFGSRSVENKVEATLDNSIGPMDMDSDICLINAATLVKDQSKEIPGGSSNEMLLGDSIFSNIDGNEHAKIFLDTNLNKVEHEVPHSCDVSKFFESSIDSDHHPDLKQSTSVASSHELKSERSVLHDGRMHENKVEDALENYSSIFPDNGQINDLKAKFDMNVSSDELETSRKSESEIGIDLGDIYGGSNSVDVAVTDMIPGVHDQSLLASMVGDSAASLVPSSDCFSNFNGILLKDAEFTTTDEKLANLPGFELRLLDMEPTKFNFLSVGQPSSLPEESLVLGGGTGLEDGLDSQMQFVWEADVQKMKGTRLFTTVCIWCRVEFSHDGFNPDTQNDSVGYICPACKAKISGQLSG